MSDISPADVMAMNGGSGFGNDGLWLFAILALFGFGGNGFFGNRGNDNIPSNIATTSDVQRATDFQALERQNNEGVAATRQAAYDVMASVKDASYNNLSETRSLETAVNAGFANQATCCCNLGNKVDAAKYDTAAQIADVRYDMATMFANANANTTAQVQRVLDQISANRIAELEQQVQALNLANATAGVVKYPMSTAFAISNPYCSGSTGF